MPAILLTPPAAEPVTLADAKAHLRVEHTADDDLIAALIAGGRVHVEAQTRRALISQSWRLIRDEWPNDGRVAVLPVPLVALTAARIYRRDGTTQAIDPAAFVIDKASAPAVIAYANGAPPVPGRVIGGIELDIDVGYGAEPDDVPEPLRRAIRMLVAHWYENRGLVGEDAAPLPQTALALIAPYRVVTL